MRPCENGLPFSGPSSYTLVAAPFSAKRRHKRKGLCLRNLRGSGGPLCTLSHQGGVLGGIQCRVDCDKARPNNTADASPQFERHALATALVRTASMSRCYGYWLVTGRPFAAPAGGRSNPVTPTII
jgi:hypothetical protein